MLGLKGSFLGFTFDGVHSSHLNIVRTFENGRLTTELLPEVQTVISNNAEVDGAFFWGSHYTKRQKNISFAFSDLTEIQIRLIKTKFARNKICELIYDEEPYKVWMAKMSNTAILKHLSFEKDGTRYYSGSGSFTFTCFYPYAKSRYPFQEDYVIENIHEWIDSINDGYYYDFFGEAREIISPAKLQYILTDEQVSGAIEGQYNDFAKWLEEIEQLNNVNNNLFNVNSTLIIFPMDRTYNNYLEWIAASGLPSNNVYGKYENSKYKIFNAGDIEMPFKILYRSNSLENGLEIKIDENNFLKLKNLIPKQEDEYILIDMWQGILQGYNKHLEPTKNYYNSYIVDGEMFFIPIGEQEIYSSIEAEKIEYNYLYL